MSNICHRCIYHEKCMMYRYNNVRTKYMEEITKKKNKDGNIVIYVSKCRGYIHRNYKYTLETLREIKKRKGIDKI